MKKRNLIVLLLFPFVIAIFCIATINTTYNMIDVDISYIDWEYKEMEAFELGDALYQLKATGVNQRHYAVTGGTDLIWSVSNRDGTEEPYAQIVRSGGEYFLKPLATGEVVLTCSNEKGNVYRQLTAVIYKDCAIMLYPTVSASGSNIDSTVYYGEYDHRIGERAKIDMTVVSLPAGIYSELYATTSDNISFDMQTGKISVLAPGEAFLTISANGDVATPVTYRFTVVAEGVNVYSYEDLLYCTNESTGGHIAVLRKHFESLENTYVLGSNEKPIVENGALKKKSNNVECFGNYDPATGKFSFGSEVYTFKTTYNTSFIEQWNEFCKTNGSYNPITDKVVAGLHVQKDFYGNGYTLNLHNLTYPYAYIPTVVDGATVRLPQLTADNLFRGPLKLYSLGDPNNMPLVSLYGQDNVGMYVDGDGITVNDINLKNCDFGDRLANLSTVGTVLEVGGNGVTVVNSRISNGKNVVRSFSTSDLVIDNCMISNAMNFLLLCGSNEYVRVDKDVMRVFSKLDGTTANAVLSAYLAKGADGDGVLNTFLTAYFKTPQEKAAMRAALESINNAINHTDLAGQYKGKATVNDTYFYRSGIASICMETQFNSPFLESATPSIINDIFGILSSEDKSLVPYVATGVSGISYPFYLEVKGSTRFYDYKQTGTVDLSGLIEENISATANSLQLYDGVIDINTIFPLWTMLLQRAQSYGNLVYRDPEDGKSYINLPVAYYGGGVNTSQVVFNTDSADDCFSADIEIDLLSTYLNIQGTTSEDLLATVKGMMLKTVTTVAGFEPFRFNLIEDGYLYGETPRATDLIENAKQK